MSHLTKEQRYTICSLREKGYNQKSIAEIIGKDRSVVSRELSRNCDKRNNGYRFELAQRKYEERISEKPKRIKLTLAVKEEIDKKLERKFSPEQIVGDCGRNGTPMVSHERIYQYVWADKRS